QIKALTFPWSCSKYTCNKQIKMKHSSVLVNGRAPSSKIGQELMYRMVTLAGSLNCSTIAITKQSASKRQSQRETWATIVVAKKKSTSRISYRSCWQSPCRQGEEARTPPSCPTL